MKFGRARYTSRRQRFLAHMRAWRLAFVAIGLALVVITLFNLRDVWEWLRTFFW